MQFLNISRLPKWRHSMQTGQSILCGIVIALSQGGMLKSLWLAITNCWTFQLKPRKKKSNFLTINLVNLLCNYSSFLLAKKYHPDALKEDEKETSKVILDYDGLQLNIGYVQRYNRGLLYHRRSRQEGTLRSVNLWRFLSRRVLELGGLRILERKKVRWK